MNTPIPGVAWRQKRLRGLLARAVSPVLLLILTSCSSGNVHTPTLSPPPTLQLSTPTANATQQAMLAQMQQEERAQGSQIATHVDTLFDNLAGQSTFSGSVLIARGGQVLLDKGYSMANWQTTTPNTPQTRFYLGSVTKEFTAMAILILQARGKLNVKQSVCTYIKSCPSPWRPVTIHDLLTHTSGIPELDASQLSDASPAAWIASFDNVVLNSTPGSQFSYCNTCYLILAYVVEQVGSMPYAQFVQQNILAPLKMTETGFDSNFYYTQASSAIGYDSWQSASDQLGYSNLDPSWSFLFGSGLLYSTVNDLYRWDQALYTTELVPQKILNEAFTSYTRNSLFAGSTYGYGWFITQSPIAGHRLIWHDGVIDGFRAYIGRYIDDHVTIIILSNLASIDSPTLAQQVQSLVFSH